MLYYLTVGAFTRILKERIQPVLPFRDLPPFEDGNSSEELLRFICQFGGSDKSLFEFGTFTGRSTLAFSQNFNRVVSIDCLSGSDIPYHSYESGKYGKGVSNIDLIIADSRTYDFKSYHEQFDVVFVDGNHSYTGALLDIYAALGLTKPGGLIFIDDAENPLMGVKEAINVYGHEVKFILPEFHLGVLVK